VTPRQAVRSAVSYSYSLFPIPYSVYIPAEAGIQPSASIISNEEGAGHRVSKPVVGIVMGSRSDYETLVEAAKVLKELEVPYEMEIVSAHRTPDRMFAYAEGAADRGLRVIIAGAGGAAHLPGMTAAKTILPVIGVPVLSSALSGFDSLLSIVQMPRGVPVATVAIGKAGATNAGILAAQILGSHDLQIRDRVRAYRQRMQEEAIGEPLQLP
jgi:5-(carboxyamino)imidazole ribonucleotide mutase